VCQECAPLCAHYRHHGPYTGKDPSSIRSLLHSLQEERSNSAQHLLLTLTGMRTSRRADASHPWVYAGLSPGPHHCASLSPSIGSGQHREYGGCAGCIQGSTGCIYQEGCIPTIPTMVVCTGSLPLFHTLRYTALITP